MTAYDERFSFAMVKNEGCFGLYDTGNLLVSIASLKARVLGYKRISKSLKTEILGVLGTAEQEIGDLRWQLKPGTKE